MGNDGVDVGGAEVDRAEAFHDLVGEPNRGVDADLECRLVGNANAIGVRDREAALFGEVLDLVARAVDEDDFDAERAQHREVEQEVWKILGGRDLAVDRDHEDALAEERDILEDFAQVGDFHSSGVGI